MIDTEKQEIVEAVLEALKVNAKTIEQLTPVTELLATDMIEISGGRRISFKMLMDAITASVGDTVNGTINSLSAADIASVDTDGRNWNGVPIRVTLRSGAVLTAPLHAVHLDPDNPDNDLAGLISPTQARQIQTDAARINTLSDRADSLSDAMADLGRSIEVTDLEVAQAQQAAQAALDAARGADDAAAEAGKSAKEAAASAKEAETAAKVHESAVAIYPIAAVEPWRYGGDAGLTAGETYLDEEDAFLTVSNIAGLDKRPELADELWAQSTGDVTYAAEGVDPAGCGRNLLLETNKHLGRGPSGAADGHDGQPQWICRTGNTGNTVAPVDHGQFYGPISKRYDTARWPQLHPSHGDQTGFNRSSLNADPATTWEVLLYPLRADAIRKGKSYTLSLTTFGGQAQGSTGLITFTAYLAKATGADTLCDPAAGEVVTLANGARRHTFHLTAKADGAGDGYYVYFNIATNKGTWDSFEVWDLKLEEGVEATPWTKAPEDSSPWLSAEIKRSNRPYNYRSRPIATNIYRLGGALYGYDPAAGLVPYLVDGSEAVGRAKRALFDDMWMAAWGDDGAIDHSKAKPYMGNGVEMSYEEALDALRHHTDLSFTDYTSMFSWLDALTLPPIYVTTPNVNFSNAFQGCQRLRRLKLVPAGTQKEITLRGFGAMFHRCDRLEEVEGVLNISGAPKAWSTFFDCGSLREVRVKGLNQDIDLHYSPNLSLASIRYMVDNAADTGEAVALTVHQEVFDKLTDESNAEWHAVLEAATGKQITFVS